MRGRMMTSDDGVTMSRHLNMSHLAHMSHISALLSFVVCVTDKQTDNLTFSHIPTIL